MCLFPHCRRYLNMPFSSLRLRVQWGRVIRMFVLHISRNSRPSHVVPNFIVRIFLFVIRYFGPAKVAQNRIVFCLAKFAVGKIFATCRDSTVLYCTIQYCTLLYNTVLYFTVQYSTVQYNTVLYCIMYCTVQYWV